MIDNVELTVWLAIAVTAFMSAQFLLWRTRRILNRPAQAPLLCQSRTVPAAVVTEMAGSVTSP